MTSCLNYCNNEYCYIVCLYEQLAVDFLYCLVLIEVLKQLHLHPVPDGQLNHIETLAFKHFKHRDRYVCLQ